MAGREKGTVYIVHEGRNPGVYKNWSAVKVQVDGYPGNCYEKAGNSKYYVVYQGFEPGVYESWEEAHKQVSGYSNNSYEKCYDRDEAESKFKNRDSQWYRTCRG